MISESPSKTTSCSPSSMEKEIAFLQARASTSSTVDGRVMRSDRAAITIPSESRITTPMPAVPVSWKSLHHYWLCTELVGEVTGVLGGPPFFAAMGCLGLIGIHGSVQWHQYRSSPKAPWLLPLSVHSYYARYPKQCMQISAKCGDFYARIPWHKSRKHTNFSAKNGRHRSSSHQTFFTSMQSQRAWIVSSVSQQQRSQREFAVMFLFIRFSFVGRESFAARQRTCWILFGRFSDQISDQNCLLSAVFEGPSAFTASSFEGSWYADLVE